MLFLLASLVLKPAATTFTTYDCAFIKGVARRVTMHISHTSQWTPLTRKYWWYEWYVFRRSQKCHHWLFSHLQTPVYIFILYSSVYLFIYFGLMLCSWETPTNIPWHCAYSFGNFNLVNHFSPLIPIGFYSEFWVDLWPKWGQTNVNMWILWWKAKKSPAWL